RRVEGNIGELAGVLGIGVEPVADVTLVGQTRQPDDANSLRDTVQGLRGVVRLLGASAIVVLKDQRVAASERRNAILSPVTARNGGGAVIKRRDAIGVFFAFADEDARVGIREQVRKAIRDALAVLYGPDPLAAAVRPALAK